MPVEKRWELDLYIYHYRPRICDSNSRVDVKLELPGHPSLENHFERTLER